MYVSLTKVNLYAYVHKIMFEFIFWFYLTVMQIRNAISKF